MFSVAVKTLVVLVPLLVSIAFITLAERKALGLIQARHENSVHKSEETAKFRKFKQC